MAKKTSTQLRVSGDGLREMRSQARKLNRDCPIVWEVITPEMAELALGDEVNFENRPESPTHTTRLLQDLEKGEFGITGDPIRFTDDGVLLDGQHRCSAIVKTGKPIVSAVIRGIDPDIRIFLDNGRPRSDADNLKMDGVSNYKLVAAITTFVWKEQKGLLKYHAYPSISNIAKKRTRESVEGISEAAHFIITQTGITRITSPAIAGYVRWKTVQIDEEMSDIFFEGLNSGAGLCVGSPILKLRDRLSVAKRNPQVTLQRQIQLGLFIKAWNLFMQGKNIKILRLGNNEEFPAFDEYEEDDE